MIRFTLDGQSISAHDDESILQAARRHGIEIPHLCWDERLPAAGNCRACLVEIDGERALAPACARQPVEGMVVHSASDRPRRAQRGVLQLLLAESGTPAAKAGGNALEYWCRKLGVTASQYAALGGGSHDPVKNPGYTRVTADAPDTSHPALHFDAGACIRCTRCLRACHDLQGNDVIGLAFRGARSRIVFDLDDPLGDSSCVACGECLAVCPTTALLPARAEARLDADHQTPSLCPYCGVGCQVSYQVRDNRIIAVEGRDGPANHGRLCVKGRFGFDYLHHPDRLNRPLIRRDDAPRSLALTQPLAQARDWFREADWDEALDLAANGLRHIRETAGPQALAGFGSAKGSNEEAYLFQKLVRCGFGSNNVDHCTRLCHASSVAALLEMIGSGAVSNPVADVALADVIIVIGSNTTENHPVAATFIKQAARDGARLIVLDPRRPALARHAWRYLRFRPDTDVALLNALMHVIVHEGLTDAEFIARRTEGFETLRQHLADYSPQRMAPICGIPADTLREVARAYATAERAMIFWGMGVSQHIHGTDNARCLIDLALITGQIGRPGTGLHPLRGQNNVQGASDVGLIPMVFPDYQRVDDPAARQHFERLWGCKLDGKPGLTVVEIMRAASQGDIRGMYIMGENPAMSDPNLNHTRQALSRLQHLVVQDLFLTETAAFADVILPAAALPEKTGTFTNTDRRVQSAHQALQPPGEARQDLELIQQIARRIGLPWQYSGPEAVFEEMRQAMPSIAGIDWQRLEKASAITYPCRNSDDPGQPVLFSERFPTPNGRGQLRAVTLSHADELPDAQYPLILITGRLLEHWHTGAMTRRAGILDQLQPQPLIHVHPQTLAELDIENGSQTTVCSRRGAITVTALANDQLQPGQVFLPFCYREAAANLLTNDALDPDGKIPEYKYCAVRMDIPQHE